MPEFVVVLLPEFHALKRQELFRDSNVDPKDFDDMDYAQKRLLVLKSSKAIMKQGSAGSYEDDDQEPAILALQHSAQWGSTRSVGWEIPLLPCLGDHFYVIIYVCIARSCEAVLDRQAFGREIVPACKHIPTCLGC